MVIQVDQPLDFADPHLTTESPFFFCFPHLSVVGHPQKLNDIPVAMEGNCMLRVQLFFAM